MSPYVSSKFAVEGFSDSLRRELQPHGVHVSVLEPGFVTTPIFSGWVPAGTAPYGGHERSFWRSFWKLSVGAPSPVVSSAAVSHAIRAASPSTRYIVGQGAMAVHLLRLLPDSWADALLRANAATAPQITDDELIDLRQAWRTLATVAACRFVVFHLLCVSRRQLHATGPSPRLEHAAGCCCRI